MHSNRQGKYAWRIQKGDRGRFCLCSHRSAAVQESRHGLQAPFEAGKQNSVRRNLSKRLYGVLLTFVSSTFINSKCAVLPYRIFKSYTLKSKSKIREQNTKFLRWDTFARWIDMWLTLEIKYVFPSYYNSLFLPHLLRSMADSLLQLLSATSVQLWCSDFFLSTEKITTGMLLKKYSLIHCLQLCKIIKSQIWAVEQVLLGE